METDLYWFADEDNPPQGTVVFKREESVDNQSSYLHRPSKAFFHTTISFCIAMERRLGSIGAPFSPLAMALNAMERSRANERMLGSYKCPCTECKGGGRAILRETIEGHLCRHSRDPTLTHCMLV